MTEEEDMVAPSGKNPKSWEQDQELGDQSYYYENDVKWHNTRREICRGVALFTDQVNTRSLLSDDNGSLPIEDVLKYLSWHQAKETGFAKHKDRIKMLSGETRAEPPSEWPVGLIEAFYILDSGGNC